jgi:hypothetical protein
MVVRLQDMAAQGDLPELGQKPAAEGMQVKEEVTAASVGPVVVIAVAGAAQADTPVQVATVAMVVVVQMPELRGQVVPAEEVALQIFVYQRVPAEVLVFKVKGEMVVPDRRGQVLEAAVAEEGAPVAALV